MAKQETPETVIDFSKLSAEDKIAAFKEATKSEDFKDVDLYAKLGLEKPKEDTVAMNKEQIEKLLPQYEDIRSKLAELGYKHEDSKMSETERKIHDRLEKEFTANLSERTAELLKIDNDFPTDIVSKMSIPTEDKITVMVAMKEVAQRNQESIDALKKELDSANSQLEEAKLGAPAEEKPEMAGDALVTAKLKEFDWEIEGDKPLSGNEE